MGTVARKLGLEGEAAYQRSGPSGKRVLTLDNSETILTALVGFGS